MQESIKTYRDMKRIKEFMDMEQWECWLYLVVLPLGFIIAGTIGYLPALLK